MIDLKGTELPVMYKNFRNVEVAGIEDYEDINESEQAILKLVEKVYQEFRRRIRLFAKYEVQDITEYNSKYGKLPHIIFIIDEINYLFNVMKKRNRETFDKIFMFLDRLTSQARSTGIYEIHAMQTINENGYNVDWRRNIMSRVCMKMGELRQCQMIIENMPEISDKAFKQRKGDYIVVKEDKEFQLQNIMINKNGITFDKLKSKFRRDSNVLEKKKTIETD
jgi:hypothetical protein